jgi:hypothetical protein
MDNEKNIKKNKVGGIHSFFKLVYAYWMKFAKVLATINSFIILFVFYFIIIGIYAVIGKLVSFFLAKNQKMDSSFWSAKEELGNGLEDLKYQF